MSLKLEIRNTSGRARLNEFKTNFEDIKNIADVSTPGRNKSFNEQVVCPKFEFIIAYSKFKSFNAYRCSNTSNKIRR